MSNLSYRDILEESLVRVRQGEDAETIATSYPAVAEQLRADLAAAMMASRVSGALPAPGASARPAFSASLAAEQRRRASRKHGGGWLSSRTPAFGLAMAAAVALVFLVSIDSGPFSSETAEAGTIEGVVVDNSGGALTLRTGEGIESIAVEGTPAVSDEAGARVELASIEPGQLLEVQGKRRQAGVFVARRIQARTSEALQSWCERNGEACVALEGQISQRVAECASQQRSCPAVASRLQVLRAQNAVLLRLKALQERCDNGGALACREIEQACRETPAACGPLREWLRNRNLR